jgi:hypothetical protein
MSWSEMLTRIDRFSGANRAARATSIAIAI